MTYGFELFDAAGTKIMDSAMELPRLVGREVFTWSGGGANQTVTNANYAGGFVVHESSIDDNGNNVVTPVLKLSGNELICRPCTSVSAGNPHASIAYPVVTTCAVYRKDVNPSTTNEHGIRVINDSGVVQIDSVHTNYGLIDSGTVTVPSGLYAFGAVEVELPWDLAYAPLIFVKSSNPVAVAFYTYSVVSGKRFAGFWLNQPGASSIDVDYKVFADARDLPAPAGHGIAVYRSDGTCCFNSNYQPLSTAGQTSVQPGLPPAGYSTWNHGVSNAYVLANYGFYSTLYSSSAYTLNVYNSGTTAYFGWAINGNFWRGVYPEAPTIYPMLIT